MNALLRLYDYFSSHRKTCWIALVMLVLALSFFAKNLKFGEDISDFLPMTDLQREQMEVYRQMNQSQKIVVLFSLRDTANLDPDRLCDAIDAFQNSTSLPIQTQIDLDEHFAQIEQRFRQMPFLLAESDFARIDSLLTRENIRAQLAQRANELQMPLSAFSAKTMVFDPLRLFPNPQSFAPNAAFTAYDGYFFSADEKMAFAFLDSPFGDSESAKNAALVDSLQTVADRLQNADFADVNIRLIGAPVVAVGNARCIKRDTFFTLSVAFLLIALLLFFSLKSVKNMLIIVLSTAFGFLFALGVLGIFLSEISLIVLGIAAIIVGIAVNYPLHLIVHRQFTATMRQNLQDELKPLLIGNLTTVGAFLALVPLKAIALRDLGLFCAAMLVGTIVFSVIFLPQINFQTPRFSSFSFVSKTIDKLSNFSPEKNKIFITLLFILTIFFAFFSSNVKFENNFSNINYMTSQQREDFQKLASLAGKSSDDVEIFLPCAESPELRLSRWQNFWNARQQTLIADLTAEANALGFRDSAFNEFVKIISHCENLEIPNKNTLSQRIFLPKEKAEDFLKNNHNAFTISALQNELTSSLSSNFDYIAFVCSIVVFLFLWISFRSLPLAVIAFAPMAVSWIWILGLMNLLNVNFNIINIILATFIFGQGDDYTVFITEGLLHERRTQKSILPQYKSEILLSAIIMFIGIGVLIFAKHPAMFSLGAVVLIGMFSVVLMAYIIPPILLKIFVKFKWIN